MFQSIWVAIAAVAVAAIISLFLLWISLRILRRTVSGRYWIAAWIPMGWLASLALAEWSAVNLVGYGQILSRYQQVPLTELQPFYVLWAMAFVILLAGFIPRLRPQTRSDRVKLIAFSLCWMGFTFSINICWVGFMIFMSLVSSV